MKCHAGEDPDSGVSLDPLMDEAAVQEHRALWESALKQLSAGAMPPVEEPRPAEQAQLAVSNWINDELYSVDCDGEHDPGRVTIRRLNRSEYGNTVRDLYGVDFQPSDSFPSDELGYGYDNNGDALTISPLLMEKYLDAAAEIAAKAVPDDEADLPVRTIAAQELDGGVHRHEARVLTSQGEIVAEWNNERPGLYKLRVKAFADQAGDEQARMQVAVDGRTVTDFVVGGVRDKPQWFVLRLPLDEGKRRLEMVFINDYYNPNHPDPAQRDRNLWISEVQVIGPILKPLEAGKFYQSIAAALPPVQHLPLSEEDRRSLEASTRDILRPLVRRAYRRPADESQVKRLSQFLLDHIEAGDSYSLALQRTLPLLLVSPTFLFRDESRGTHQENTSRFEVDEFSLASRLSFFLWSSTPDEELLRLAERNELKSNLPQQVERMLKDEKSQAFIADFAGQWLSIRQLPLMTPDPEQFGEFDAELAAAMSEETLRFFGAVLRENRTLFELLDADYTYLNERLARHYGIGGVRGNEFRRVKLADRRRGGVITQASVLTLTSNPTRTSPVKRGKWILEQILGDAPPPAPANVPELAEQEGELTGTLRERMEQHRTNQVCASCHRMMDPLGFALENFDAVGRWRDHEDRFEIDARGELPDGTKFDGPAGLKQLLLQRKDDFRQALARQMLTYALGRGLEYYDVCEIDEVCRETKVNGDTLAAMMLAITQSEPFQYHRLASDGEGAKR